MVSRGDSNSDLFGFRAGPPVSVAFKTHSWLPSAHSLAPPGFSFLGGGYFSTLDKGGEGGVKRGLPIGTRLFPPLVLPSSQGPEESSFSQAAAGSAGCSYILHLKLIAEFYFIIQQSFHARCIALLFPPLAYYGRLLLIKLFKNVYSHAEYNSYHCKPTWGL